MDEDDTRPVGLVARLRRAAGGVGARAAATDWWSVLVELVVVIAGILIAFELNDWDRQRQARADEAVLLRGLAEEARSDTAALERMVDHHNVAAGDVRAIRAAIGRARSYPACRLLRLPAVERSSANGFEAGDRPALVSDARLRHLIRKAEAQQGFNDRQLDYFRQSFGRYAASIEPHMRWGDVSASRERCAIDLAALARDPLAMAYLPKIERDQLRFADYRAEELAAVRAVAERTACLRSGDC